MAWRTLSLRLPHPAPITLENGKLICAGLGVAFGKLAQPSPDCPYAKARRAVAYLGQFGAGDPKGDRFFAHHDREADKLKTPHPHDLSEAIAWLTAGVAQAGRELKDPFLRGLLKPEQVSFKLLRQFLDGAESPRIQRRTNKQPSKRPADAVDNTKPLRLNSTLEPRIQDGIERVAREAWKAAATAAPDDRLRIAKQEAERSITRLSPHIRKQVNHLFRTEKWQPLIERGPKL